MKFTETINAARLRAGAMLRERRERAAEKKAAKAQQRGGHDSRFWLLSIPATATLCAAFVEIYWAILFCIEATGQLDGSWSTSLGSAQAAAGAWHFIFDIRNMFVLIGLVAATIPIVMWSMVWLPVQMKARGHGRWRRLTMIGAGLLANALVIMSGTVVMNSNRQDQVRAGLVVEQSADQGRQALVARRDAVHQRWVTLTEPSNTTLQAQAARAGVAGWDAYIATARQQATAGTISAARLALIERARGSAVAAEAYVSQEDTLTGQIAAAAPVAATQANVRDDVGVGLNTFAQYATVYRPPFVALICTIIGIFGAWWWVGLSEAMDRHNVSLSGWADEGHRIEDLREEEPIVVDRDAKGRVNMKPPRRKYTEADTGEEIEETLIPAHYRKLKKGKPQQVHITPDLGPEEQGVPPERDGRDAELRSSMHQPVEEWSAAEGERAQDGGDKEADRARNESADNGEADAARNVHPQPEAVEPEADHPEQDAHPEPPEPDFTDEARQSINALVEDAPNADGGEVE